MRRVLIAVVALAAAAGAPGAAVAQVAPVDIERVSVDSEGGQAAGDSSQQAVSGDGRFVAFSSAAPDLVPGDTNGATDVFVRDRDTGATTRTSVSGGGRQASGASTGPQISPDGRLVLFTSDAADLVARDTNGNPDVFVRDRQAGTTLRVSVSDTEQQANAGTLGGTALSADGRFVAFDSLASNLVPNDRFDFYNVFLRDRANGTTTLVSTGRGRRPANGTSSSPVLTPDGRFVFFTSGASNLVAGDTNDSIDVFVRDRTTGSLARVSIGDREQQGNSSSLGGSAVSADGRFVAFDSDANNLVPRDLNGVSDVFIRDRLAGTTTRVSGGYGEQQANDSSNNPAVSAGGGLVAFDSLATNLVEGDTNDARDVFVYDLSARTTRRASVGESAQADGFSFGPDISGDARLISFGSSATNLVADDTNRADDAFVRALP